VIIAFVVASWSGHTVNKSRRPRRAVVAPFVET
jgi:hypothetical protein